MPSRPRGDIRIGISGWRYAGWRGVFYPENLPQKRELEYAAKRFRTIEINGTFYSLQKPELFRAWYEATPEDFVFAVKGARFITHMKRLKDCRVPLANFFASGVLALGDKLGPVLWQLPPNFRFDAERLAAFFDLLPRNTAEAASLARKHDERVSGRSLLIAPKNVPIRHALEVRHDSFRGTEFIRLLRKKKVGLVVADTVNWPCFMDVTADFVYCRLHGSEQLYTSGYCPRALDRWAERVLAWASGMEANGEHIAKPGPHRARREVFLYFDNDAKVRAPRDAQALVKRVARFS
jgi:uncharacterized protein YecE (DUF72 family)